MADQTEITNSLSSLRATEDANMSVMDSALNRVDRASADYISDMQNADFVDTAQVRADVRNILLGAGFYDAVNAVVNEGYQDAIDNVYDLYAKSSDGDLLLGETELEELNRLKQLDAEEYNKFADDYILSLTRTIVGVTGDAVGFDLALEEMRKRVDTLGNKTRAWITTGINSVYTVAGVMFAIEVGATKFRYVGPLDDKTRPFCREHLNEVRTIDDWNTLDNGQILPVSVYKGGFNCRHSLVGEI
jgi:hypothetical protein